MPMSSPDDPSPDAVAYVSQSAARYLEAIYYIHHEGEVVRAGRLAEWLGVAAPTVTEAVKKLVRDSLLTIGAGRSLLLTAAGLTAAEDIVRRHRIAEVWLFHLGLDWESADEEAHRLSFYLSDRVLEKLLEQLGRPLTCPHGNAIPGVPQQERDLIRLDELAAGQVAYVGRISEVAEQEAPTLLDVLYRSGLVPGRKVEVAGETDAAEVVAIHVDGRDDAYLARSVAKYVWVDLRETPVPAEL
ncbi:MAG: DtxR family transcriptional regulator, Mn-dependent transcriptional regulator [Frankiaceae bacterium]|nr:DtxR family transcriptional regulator, Mn-dependent transcriptional regulator [Frankiaceae bacterium]